MRRAIPVEITDCGTKITINPDSPIFYNEYINDRYKKTKATEVSIRLWIPGLAYDIEVLELIMRHALIDHIGDSSSFFLVEDISMSDRKDCLTALLSEYAFELFNKKLQNGTLPMIEFFKSSQDSKTLEIYIAKTDKQKKALHSIRESVRGFGFPAYGPLLIDPKPKLNTTPHWSTSWLKVRYTSKTGDPSVNASQQHKPIR